MTQETTTHKGIFIVKRETYNHMLQLMKERADHDRLIAPLLFHHDPIRPMSTRTAHTASANPQTTPIC